MALLLSFDSATPHLAVVLSEDARLLASREDASSRLTHAEHLNVFIDEVMKEAGRSLDALDAVAVGIGPGSYTGLRIGLSAAKGLCFALDKPLIGMSTLDVLLAEAITGAHYLTAHDVLYPMVDARRMEVFTRPFKMDGSALGETSPLILDEEWCASRPEDARTFVFGDGADKAVALWEKYSTITHIPGIRPAVKGLVRCAEAQFAHRSFSDLAYLVPEYGKPANVAQKRGAP